MHIRLCNILPEVFNHPFDYNFSYTKKRKEKKRKLHFIKGNIIIIFKHQLIFRFANERFIKHFQI